MFCVKRRDNLFGGPTHRPQPRALGEQHGAKALDARVELVVDHHVVVLDKRRDLFPRRPQPALHGRFRVLAAAAQPLLEHS